MNIGTGTTISFESGFLTQILDISGPEGSREAINVSHMETTVAHAFTPATLKDWGELTVEMGLVPATAIPLGSAASSVVITWNDSAGTTWTFEGFMTGFSPANPLEEKMTSTVTIKVSGDVEIG